MKRWIFLLALVSVLILGCAQQTETPTTPEATTTVAEVQEVTIVTGGSAGT